MSKKLKQIKFQMQPKRRNIFCIPEDGTALDNALATALDVARDTITDAARGMAKMWLRIMTQVGLEATALHVAWSTALGELIEHS